MLCVSVCGVVCARVSESVRALPHSCPYPPVYLTTSSGVKKHRASQVAAVQSMWTRGVVLCGERNGGGGGGGHLSTISHLRESQRGAVHLPAQVAASELKNEA